MFLVRLLIVLCFAYMSLINPLKLISGRKTMLSSGRGQRDSWLVGRFQSFLVATTYVFKWLQCFSAHHQFHWCVTVASVGWIAITWVRHMTESSHVGLIWSQLLNSCSYALLRQKLCWTPDSERRELWSKSSQQFAGSKYFVFQRLLGDKKPAAIESRVFDKHLIICYY